MTLLCALALAMAAGLLMTRVVKKVHLPNVTGYLVAGLLIGFAEVMLSTYTVLPIPKDAVAFVVLIIVLLIKPSGLFGQRNKV